MDLGDIKDTITGGIMKPFEWVDKAETETGRKVKLLVLGGIISGIGALALTLLFTQIMPGGITNFSLTMTTLPVLGIGVGLAGFGVGLIGYKFNKNGPSKHVKTAAKVVALLSFGVAAGLLTMMTFRGGFVKGTFDMQYLIVPFVDAAFLGVLYHSLAHKSQDNKKGRLIS